uniref:Out at first C-terminal domain-containing protein n=1 Tax=Dermatophagoides pteronyssinus TaxID=6956 RepID=A0A6P6XMZ3_DERPT|nr:putative uncharacterized protein DDB_G0282129 [Dermatophagoides pteronyssinus]
MSRLSQKNPGAIRYADEDRGQQSYHMDLEILIDHNDDGNDDDGDDGNILGTKRHRKSKSKSTIPIISPHIKDNCVTNQDWPSQNHHHHYRIYASYDDFRHWTDGHRTFANISNAIKKLNYSTNQANNNNNNNDSKLTNNNDGVGGIQSNRNNQKFRLRSSLQHQQQQKHSNLTNNEQQMENKLKLANQNQERMRCGQIISNWMFNNNNNNDGHQLESSQVTNQSNSLLSSILMIKSMFNNHHRHQQQQPCHCSLNIFIPWYVCGVRYCPIQQQQQQSDQQSDQQQQQQQNTQRYRCGVRTCRKRYQFTFAVPNHIHCLSDFDPTLSSDTMMAFDNFIINNDNEIESLSNDQNRSIQI